MEWTRRGGEELQIYTIYIYVPHCIYNGWHGMAVVSHRTVELCPEHFVIVTTNTVVVVNYRLFACSPPAITIMSCTAHSVTRPDNKTPCHAIGPHSNAPDNPTTHYICHTGALHISNIVICHQQHKPNKFFQHFFICHGN